SIRSQMAEGFFRSMAGENLDVVSAGVSPAGIHPVTMMVMREDGVDISGQWSKSVGEIDAKNVDYLVTLGGHARDTCPPFPRKIPSEHWPINDPIGASGTPEERMQKFRETREEIRRRVKELVRRLSDQT